MLESFPRMWDQLARNSAIKISDRIIPTHVGSTVSNPFLNFSKTNHSHACGINTNCKSKTDIVNESFPRMWDQQADIYLLFIYVRIIPTHVGSTTDAFCKLLTITNHSHACGINPLQRASAEHVSESFPRMWDQRHEAEGGGQSDRIIPTHVGSTMRVISTTQMKTNHSHACGINRIDARK